MGGLIFIIQPHRRYSGFITLPPGQINPEYNRAGKSIKSKVFKSSATKSRSEASNDLLSPTPNRGIRDANRREKGKIDEQIG